jgi:hypothetical protein
MDENEIHEEKNYNIGYYVSSLCWNLASMI